MHIGARSTIMFPLILLLLLAILTFWVNKAVQPPEPKIDGSSRHDPDYIMSNFVTTQTDINGDLRYKLAATEMRHFPDDDSTQLQRPHYTQFAVDKPYTQVEGLRGQVSNNGEEIELFEEVKVTRQAYAGKGEMTVETAYLKIFPDEELVTTPNPVVIRQAPKTVIYATGMVYEKKKHTVTLLHKVRAHYERPKIKRAPTKAAVTKKTGKAKVTKSPVAKAKVTNKQANTSKPKPSNTKNARIRRTYE